MNTKTAIDPLTFDNPREYLFSILAERKRKNPKFSIRAWARQLGYKNSSLLADVLAGRRRFTADIRNRLAENLKLAGRHRRYFESLALMIDAKHISEKQNFAQICQDLNPQFPITSVAIDQFQAIREWFHLIIIEMVDLVDFQEDPTWISRRIFGKLSPLQIRSALERLQRLGFLKRSSDGKLGRHQGQMIIGDGSPHEATRHHHTQFLECALQALKYFPAEKRDFSGSTLAFNKNDLPEVRSLIEKFHYDLNRIAKSNADEVYRVNVQLFPATKRDLH